MTDTGLHFPAQVIDIELPDTESVHGLEDLAYWLSRLRIIRRTVADYERLIETKLAAAMPAKLVEVGGFTIERNLGYKRREWDHDGLVSELRMRATEPKYRCDPMTGEVVYSESEALAKLFKDCAAVSYWRMKELEGIGVDVDDYCTKTPGHPTVRFL